MDANCEVLLGIQTIDLGDVDGKEAQSASISETKSK
jgi:hypothetical protein